MWKVKLDKDLWLADGDPKTSTNEADAWLLPDMSSVQEQLKEVRRFMPYPNAVVIFEDDLAQPV